MNYSLFVEKSIQNYHTAICCFGVSVYTTVELMVVEKTVNDPPPRGDDFFDNSKPSKDVRLIGPNGNSLYVTNSKEKN